MQGDDSQFSPGNTKDQLVAHSLLAVDLVKQSASLMIPSPISKPQMAFVVFSITFEKKK